MTGRRVPWSAARARFRPGRSAGRRAVPTTPPCAASRRGHPGAHRHRRLRPPPRRIDPGLEAPDVRAVAERAGVSERTVYRHFGNERGLTDAVMHRLEKEAGIDLEGMGLDDIATVATRILGHVASYPIGPRPPLDATLVDANRRQKDALLGAVAGAAPSWPEDRRTLVASLSTSCGVSRPSSAWSVTGGSRPTRPWAPWRG